MYCLSGDTAILLADGRTRALADLRAGDEIYGTARRGGYRRYTRARVLAHWRVIKPAYRILLEDGTELVAGPDHRFLTERGWKFIVGAGNPGKQRPHLTLNNTLMGVGRFAATPPTDPDYKLGYLCGMIRGDAHFGSFPYQRADRNNDDQHRFRLALCDDDAVVRTQGFLRELGIATQRFLFQAGARNRKTAYAIRTSSSGNLKRITQLVDWPTSPSNSWCRGFLAGSFDAEGSYSNGILRISNSDKAMIAGLGRALKRHDFEFALEHVPKKTGKDKYVIRVRGGLREHLRFFHITDNAILRKRDISGQTVKSSVPLRVVRIEPLNRKLELFDITTTTGDFIANGVVSHNCYARPSHAYLNLSPGLDFETKIFYKAHAAELLEQELRRPGYHCEPITLGANTDPYQPAERKLRVTRSLLEVMQRFGQPVSIITKSALIARDLDLLAELARLELVSVMVSVTTLDDELKRRLEPRTPGGLTRLKTVRALADAGVPVGVLVAPIIPLINDAELERILEQAAEAGARGAGYVLLRLPYEVKDLFREWLQTHLPMRAGHVMSIVQQTRGGRDYDARFGTRMRGSGEFAELIAQRFRLACKRHGLLQGRRLTLATRHFKPPPEGGQLGFGFD
ncbi:MAG TPA: PA0069 family radical SAM protein [Gammaproteobacteria bacterium]|nr:PA0069 family radical SAM protein [Gammaproteobacteria bacterium]